jgi:general stress protein CsbA
MQKSSVILFMCVLMIVIWTVTQNHLYLMGSVVMLIYAAHERYKEYKIPAITR